MTTPSLGMQVRYNPAAGDNIARLNDDPLLGIIVAVHDEHAVNLTVYDANGNSHACTAISLIQDADPRPDSALSFCELMP